MNLIRSWIQSNREKALSNKNLQQFLSGMVRPFDVMNPTGIKPDNSNIAKINQYKSWVYTCANKNSAAIGKAQLRLFATRGKGQPASRAKAIPVSRRIKDHLSTIPALQKNTYYKTAEEIEEVVEHPFLTLMQNFNDYENEFENMEKLSLFLDITGDSYWYVVRNGLGVPVEIWTLQSQYVTIVPDRRNFIKGYLYGRDRSKLVPFFPEEIVHFKRPSLTSPWYGTSRVEGAYVAIMGYNSMESYETALTENSAIPSILIKYKNRIDPQQRKDLLRSWNNALQGIAKTGKTFVADLDFDVEKLSFSPREIGFLKGREWRQKEIVNAFGQPLALYEKDANRANIEGAIFLWEEYEITPSLRRIEQKLNEKLIPMFNEPRIFVAFDPVTKQDKAHELAIDSMLLANGYPVNRILIRRGHEPVDNGDIGLVNQSMVPLGTPPANALGMPSTDPLLRMALSAHKPDRSTKSSDSPGGNHIISVKADGDADIDLTGGANLPMDSNEKRLARSVKQVFEAQTTLALETVTKMDAASFDWVASDDWAEEIVKLSQGVIREEVIIGGLQGQQTAGIRLGDFVDRPGVQSAIKDESFRFAREIGTASQRKLQTVMNAGLEAGESMKDIQKRIEGVYDGWKGYRAERIARTETKRAFMTGQEQAWKETGVVVAKVWDALGDSCPFCQDMDGKRVQIGEPYWTTDGPEQVVQFQDREIKLPHVYADVMGPPLHPNCRCDLKPEFIEF